MTRFSVEILPGETVALVGESGQGKSTLLHLIQRFHNINGGQILLDGTPINQLNIKWLRSQIGLVSQEPVLFNTTIKENILYGATSDVSDKDVETACIEANALGFIKQFKDGFDTMVGAGGSKLSGGQKQRVAIARALIRKPKIMLFDEATSALDNESESVVQKGISLKTADYTLITVHECQTRKCHTFFVLLYYKYKNSTFCVNFLKVSHFPKVFLSVTLWCHSL